MLFLPERHDEDNVHDTVRQRSSDGCTAGERGPRGGEYPNDGVDSSLDESLLQTGHEGAV